MKLNYLYTQEKTIKRGQLYYDKLDELIKLAIVSKKKTFYLFPIKLFFENSDYNIENNIHYTLDKSHLFDFKESIKKYNFIENVDFKAINNNIVFISSTKTIENNDKMKDSLDFLKYVRENYHYVQGQKGLYRKGYYKIMSDVDIYNEYLTKN